MIQKHSRLFQLTKHCMSHSMLSTYNSLVWVIPILHVRQLRLRGPAGFAPGLRAGRWWSRSSDRPNFYSRSTAL